MRWNEGGEYVESSALCRAQRSKDCLGADFFHTLDPNRLGDIENLPAPGSLLDILANDIYFPNGKVAPVFLCVAIDHTFINGADIKPGQAKDLKNASSIMAVVLWPGANNIDGQPRISLYTGGDAGEDEEEVLLNWVGQNCAIEIVKAGHHGSHFSTHANFFRQGRNLQSLVISAGEEYGHPSAC
jgi:hypothetical protein